MTVVALGRDEHVPGRPSTDPEHTIGDTERLESMRQALRRQVASGEHRGSWRDRNGDDNLLVLPGVDALVAAAPAVAVGFFGHARPEVDHAPISRLEQSLLRRARGFRGLLAYYNVHFAAHGQWANLVVFASPEDLRRVAEDAEHSRAITLTPVHYRSLRLHRYLLAEGALGPAPLEWLRTTYFDFDVDPPWRGVRER